MPEKDFNDKEKEEARKGVPLKQEGEFQVPLVDTLPQPPADQKIHERRFLPIVPTKKSDK